ncbi:MAG: hypothetical protein ACI965_000740 [Paraglaciecola sp.]|jgi:hypothetical protein
MKYLLRLTSHFLIAVLCTFILASLAHSQFVLAELRALGIKIDLANRLTMSIDDLLGLLPIYAPAIGLSLLVALGTAALLKKYRPQLTPLLYPLAGFVAILVMLLAMHPILGITLIAGARSTLGFVSQCLAGLIGGWLFMQLRTKIQSHP